MKLLVAVDGSEPALNAVRKLIEYAMRGGQSPEVNLLHVLEPGATGAARPGDRSAETEDAGMSQAGEWIEGARLALRVHELTGTAAESIVRAADELYCDMIWMGTCGTNAARARMVGSTAEAVLRLSKVPVVLVK